MSKRFEFLLLTLLMGLMRGQSQTSLETPVAAFSAALLNGVLRVGTDCSEHTPCNVRYGNVVYGFKSPATIRASGPTSGLVFIYVDNSGNLTAASKVLLECQRCSYAPGVTQFPPDSIPLFTWTIVGGVFTEAGHSDFRALFSTKRIVGGSGILMLENGGAATVSVDPTLVPMHILSTPKMSHENCTTGEFSFDNDYYYVCVAANTWKRLPLSSF